MQQPAPQQTADDGDEVNLLEYWDIIVDSRKLVGAISALALAAGLAYAYLATPVYESNLLIQVEDSQTSAKSVLGEAASLFDVKTPATAEMEIIRSRMIVGRAVDKTLIHISARPKRLPVVGNWLSRRATELSNPMMFGWTTGTERIQVSEFEVTPSLEDTPFTLIVLGGGKYELRNEDLAKPLQGVVGESLKAQVFGAPFALTVAELEGKPGAVFELQRSSRQETVERLQDRLKLSEKGRQSGVIDVSLQDNNQARLALVLNTIGEEYVRQNVDRKSAEAEKTLAFLDIQLPQFKKQLEQAEETYNKYRNKQGTVALDEEAKLALGQTVDLQSKLLEAQQKRRELISRFTPEHPTVKTLDAQIGGFNAQIAALNSRVKNLPLVQQDAFRLERDVKVNNELYQQLRNSALQLQLVREGKVGNVRLIDAAVVAEVPVRPKKSVVVAMALAIGVLGGILIALARAAFFRGVRSPQEIEAQTGLSVYSTIPLSSAQESMAALVAQKAPGRHILAETAPRDVAIEALRSLRTALQFAMLESTNNRVLITGGTPGVGKSFVSANFAAVMASAGKRVLLIDADIRKGHLNQYFGIAREGGLSELITGGVTKEQAIRRAVLPNLDVIPTGTLPPNPAELLVSSAFGSLIESLSADYDLVIIDSAPVLVAADTLSIANMAGALFLVARAGQTYVGDLHESARRLLHAGKAPTGVLFNALDLSQRHYGKYGYKYGTYNYANYNYKYGSTN
ncbi:polysaccharide biosynthesis tyrosine autokinase [Ramlibacter sp. CrO1]|uniref:Putative tyrosine-protein kinase EpsB n=2 Tax=Ramlibacter algicola TaxID=2795217 RepID=A0A934PZH3_9BURK|nr:polysaccharide biosynthesis tyrosine autokinase [Ramlibacter algicola]